MKDASDLTISDLRQLSPKETVETGDFVTVNECPESGFRTFTGAIGERASSYSYPIYRLADGQVFKSQLKEMLDHDSTNWDLFRSITEKAAAHDSFKIKND